MSQNPHFPTTLIHFCHTKGTETGISNLQLTIILPSEPFIEIQHEVFASRGDSEKNPTSRWDSNPRPSVILSDALTTELLETLW